MPRLDSLHVPAIRIESERLLPQRGVLVDKRQARHNDRLSGQSVAAGQDQVFVRGPPRPEGRVMQALDILDELIEEGQRVRGVVVPLRRLINPIVDQFQQEPVLQELVLHPQVCDQTVQQPRSSRP